MSVSPDELTGTEQAVLLVLMAEARVVRNPELKALGPELRPRERDRLNRLGLIKTTPGKPSMVHELTDDGWRLCAKIFGEAPPDGVKPQGRVLYTVMKALRDYFEREDLRPADVFTARQDVESRVRSGYSRLAAEPGGWVQLTALRSELRDVSRDELDATLVRMYRLPGVSLIPEENQKTLTDADRQAGLEIGDQAKHLIAIERR